MQILVVLIRTGNIRPVFEATILAPNGIVRSKGNGKHVGLGITTPRVRGIIVRVVICEKASAEGVVVVLLHCRTAALKHTLLNPHDLSGNRSGECPGVRGWSIVAPSEYLILAEHGVSG